ncbi:glycosyl hydrolase family 85 [Ostertagia ostertagi]
MVEPIGGLDALWNWSRNSAESVDVKQLANYRDNSAEGKPETDEFATIWKRGIIWKKISEDGIIISAEKPSPYVFPELVEHRHICYFSHNFVTIPPIGYINVAHAHGCLVLGTFITEWKGGAKICDQFLESVETVAKTVDCLVSVAEHYKFDGWLINIENRILVKHIDNLKLFLRLLTDKMREATRFSRVIWYDSVTVTGMLKWQNMLNELNRDWYECCDGIYLNYNWNDGMLLRSADFGAIHKIYVGIDCFARGCVGGWDCHRSFAKTNLMRMSVALFAPGWICERFPDANPIEHGLRLFNFDLKCQGCRITARARRDIKIVVNDVIQEGHRKGDDIVVTIREPIHLHTLDICTDDMMDCLLYSINITEM